MFCILNAKSNQLSVIRDCILIVNHRKNRNRILGRLIRFRTVVCASCNCSRGIFFNPVTVWQNLRFNQLRRGKNFRRCNSIFLFCEKSCILPFSTNMGQSTGFCTPLINPQFSAHQQLIRVGDLFGLINQRRFLYPPQLPLRTRKRETTGSDTVPKRTRYSISGYTPSLSASLPFSHSLFIGDAPPFFFLAYIVHLFSLFVNNNLTFITI